MPAPEQLDELQAFAIELALGAGRIQMDGLSTAPEISFKSARELVTPIDHACEEYIVGRIRERYPDHGYLAEEGHVAEGPTTNLFLVDSEGLLLTPPPAHVLLGVTRASILELAQA